MILHPDFKPSLLSSAISKRASACLIAAGLLGGEQVWANESAADVSVFDIDTLKSRGIDPKLAQLFAQTTRFLPGRTEVALYVNGERAGKLQARFDDEGQLCFDKRLLDKAGLVIPQTEVSQDAQAVNSLTETAREESEAIQVIQADPPETASRVDAVPDKTLFQHASGPISAWASKPSETMLADAPGMDDVSETQCYDFKAAFPQTEVDLRPGKQEVRLTVPQEALKPAELDYSGYSTGGIAGLLNYEALTMTNQSASTESTYNSLSTEAGINVGDWSLRSRQNFIDQDGVRTSQHLYAYAQRTFLTLGAIVQAGQLNIASPIFSGASITGVQILPDSALNPNGGSGNAMIEGIAQTPQARVEVKQDGILIYSAVVPAGPFLLKNIPLLRGYSNVDVTVFESDGSENSFSLPAASLHQVNLSTTGLSMAAGKVRDVGDAGMQEPEVLTISNDWLVGNRSKISAGVLVSADYNATGAVYDTVLSKDSTLSVSNVVSQAKESGEKGIQSSLTARTKIIEGLTASTSITHQSDGYRNLLDTTQAKTQPIDPFDPLERYRYKDDIGKGLTQYSTNLGFSTKHFGGGGVGVVQSKSGDGDWGRTFSASWGKSFKGVSVNATYQKDLAGDAGNAAFVSISVPLGQTRSLQTRAGRSGNGETQLSSTYNETVNDTLNYSLSAGQQGSGSGTDFSGTVAALPRYTQVNLGYTQNGDDSSSYNVSARGAVVFHPDGITPSPYHVQDTFGIVSVGDEAGIKIVTPNGTVWTDGGGRAVVPQIPAYSSSRVEVVTSSLPRNVDITNGFRNVEAGRGSVSRIDFDVVKVRRILLSARDQDGVLLPKGAAVISKNDTFITTVVDDGKIFLEDAAQQSLSVNLPGGKHCTLAFDLAEEADLGSYFEQSAAVCTVNATT